MGSMTDESGSRYEGEWENGKPHGKGTYISNEKLKIVGEFKNGLVEGKATLSFPDGTKIVGDYKEGSTKKGSIFYPDGDKYEGELKNLEPHGYGIFLFGNGDKYSGEFKDGLKHGKGIYYYRANNKRKGDKYDGEWKDNRFNGYGIYTHANGDKYAGVWQDDRRHGNGIYTFASGEISEGRWENGELVKKNGINNKILIKVITQSAPDADGDFMIMIQFDGVASSLEVNGEEHGPNDSGMYILKKWVPGGRESEFKIKISDKNGNYDRGSIFVKRDAIKKDKSDFSLKPKKLKAVESDDAVAVIIGIASYKNLPRAEFANEDAIVFSEYATKALGVKPENIKLLIDSEADEISIIKTFKNWLPNKVKPTTKLYIYYSGHGLPTADGKGFYLMPPLVDRDFISQTSIQFREIVSYIKAANPGFVTIFLDSCYSGQSRSGEILLGNIKPVSLKVESWAFPENFTVLTASKSDQISSSSNDLKHGIFSYFLMRGMEGDADGNKDGAITVGEMHTYLSAQVMHHANIQNRLQEPQIIGDINRVLIKR